MKKAGYKVQQPNIFGRLGEGFGKGLAEQIPKEVERNRLAQGLQALNQQQGLTPFQQFSGLATLPGTSPQIIQTGGDLLKQQSYLDALKNQYEGQQSKNVPQGYIPSQQELGIPVKGEIPTLATSEGTAESYKSFIPPTEQEERAEAYQNFNANPARYDYKFENALAERKGITSRNQEIQQALQAQEIAATAKEDKVKNALKAETTKLGLGKIPPKAYQKIEEKIINAILSKKEGGEGLTQESAVKKYSKEAQEANKNYIDLSTLSPWSPKDFSRRANALQKDFKSRDEQQLMADQIVEQYQTSPSYASHVAYPVRNVPKVKKIIDEIQFKQPKAFPIVKKGELVGTQINKPQLFSQLKNAMGTEGSPLSIGYELGEKGIDPREWIKYLDNNRDKLQGWQIEELNKNINILNLKDMWLRAFEE